MNLNNLILELNRNLNDRSRANCFNAVKIYWQDSKVQKLTGPQEFVEYIATNFQQISLDDSLYRGDVCIVWSRSDFQLPIGQINLNALANKNEGYPFGLLIEHSFVYIEENQVFHKPDPKSSSLYQMASFVEVVNSYQMVKGFELTRHRRL